MEKFTLHTGLVAPLDLENVDTDAIVPKQFMKSISRSGFGPHAFDAWRYLDEGHPGIDNTTRLLNPAFVLNQPRYRGASILLTRRNFGCGSSREHAPWALMQYGFRALIGPGFAEIFYNNCFKNGLLPIVLPEAHIARLFEEVDALEGFRITIDLERQILETSKGVVWGFDVEAFKRYCLLNGYDDIELTLRHADLIRCFEAAHLGRQPWLARMID